MKKLRHCFTMYRNIRYKYMQFLQLQHRGMVRGIVYKLWWSEISKELCERCIVLGVRTEIIARVWRTRRLLGVMYRIFSVTNRSRSPRRRRRPNINIEVCAASALVHGADLTVCRELGGACRRRSASLAYSRTTSLCFTDRLRPLTASISSRLSCRHLLPDMVA